MLACFLGSHWGNSFSQRTLASSGLDLTAVCREHTSVTGWEKKCSKQSRGRLEEENERKGIPWKVRTNCEVIQQGQPSPRCLFPSAVAHLCHRAVPKTSSWSEAGPALCPINTHKSFTCCTHQRQLFFVSAEICHWSELPILNLRELQLTSASCQECD